MPEPRIRMRRANSGPLEVTWPTIPGERYRVRAANQLSPEAWSDLGTSQVASDFELSISVPASSPSRFSEFSLHKAENRQDLLSLTTFTFRNLRFSFSRYCRRLSRNLTGPPVSLTPPLQVGDIHFDKYPYGSSQVLHLQHPPRRREVLPAAVLSACVVKSG